MKYDLIVVGGGPAGYVGAIRAAQLGKRVACVEKERAGGTCLNWGCIPTKSLLRNAELYHLLQHRASDLGFRFDNLAFDWSKIIARSRAVSDKLASGVEFLFRKHKIENIKATASIPEAGRVACEGADGKQQILEADSILVATGATSRPMPGLPVNGKTVIDSHYAMIIDPQPKRLIIVGAGAIGVEFAYFFNAFGTEVTLVEMLPNVLPVEDTEISVALERALTKQGIAFKLSSKVTGAKAQKNGVELTVEPVDGGEAETLKADYVLLAIGRKPFTEGLGLESVGIVPDKRGIIETDHFRTSAPGVWAIGDVTHGPMLAHKAEDEAVACVELIAGKAGHVNYDVIPSVTYTYPEVATVGKTEEELKAAGVDYKVGKFPFTANARAKVNHEAEGFVKVLADAKTDRILGVHMIGPDVGEMIGEYCVAMEFSAASEDVARTCHPHPTRSEALRQAAMGVEGWTMQA